MKIPGPGACPLCGKPFTRAQLHAHIFSEHPATRGDTIRQIQSLHPQWTHESGACPACWNLHRTGQGRGADVTWNA